MTVANQIPYQSFTANGSQTNFALGFYVDDKNHFEVKKNDLVVTKNDYSYDSGSNSLVFNITPKQGDVIEIQRSTRADRSTTYATYNNNFRPEVLNKDLDRIWLKIQELGVANTLLKIYTDKLHIEQKDYIDNKNQIINNIISDLRNYVNQQDHTLTTDIRDLKNYTDLKDNERNNYFERLINQQGVALEQLDNYYNYLLQSIANIAVAKGWAASFIADESGKSQQELNDLQALKNSDMISIFDFDRSLKATKNLDSSSKINSIIQQIESTNTIPYLYFPTHAHNYRLDNTLTFRKPVPMLFGFLPPNYDRDGYKDMNGWFLVNTPVAVDLGASESTNPGGSWTIKNIGFKPLKTDDNYTQDAIHITSARNGPERGYTFSEVSVSKMNRGIYVKNSANFMAATMIVERCNLSQNNYAIYCDQKVDGLRIVGNQIEQCKVGAFKLRGAGGIYIADNMLEGQPNTIDVDGISVQTGTRLHITRNYFEANFGDFLISYKDTSYGKGSLIIENNQIADLGINWQQPEGKVIDFCRIYNNQYYYGYTVINKETYPISFMDDASILPGSQLYGKQFQYYLQKGFNGNLGSKVFTNEPAKAQKDSSYTQMDTRGPSVETLIETPFGTARSPNTSDYLTATVSAKEGDVITANILFKTEFSESLKSGISLVVYNNSVSQLLQLSTAMVTQELNGKYILGTFTFKMPSAQPIVLLKVYNATETNAIQMIAGCFKNHGQFVDQVKVKQVLPDLSRTFTTIHHVLGESIAIGVTKTYTIPLTGAKVGDFLEYSFTNLLNNLEKKIEITSNNTLVLTLKNPTDLTIIVPDFRCFIKVSKG